MLVRRYSLHRKCRPARTVITKGVPVVLARRNTERRPMSRPDKSSSFDVQRIESETFIEGIEFYGELPSTNDRALQLDFSGQVATPLLVLAQRQTAGRGRGRHRWWSSEGALTFTLVIDAAAIGLSMNRLPPPPISLTSGLAICESLDDLVPSTEIGLKWPNDVCLYGRKICGILIEVLAKQRLCAAIGIGLNVNNSLSSAPKELQSVATSLIDVTGRTHDLTDVMIHILNSLETELRALAACDTALPERWRSRCVLRGRHVQIETETRKSMGICQGIDSDGAIILQTQSGTQRIFSGVVTRVA